MNKTAKEHNQNYTINFKTANNIERTHWKGTVRAGDPAALGRVDVSMVYSTHTQKKHMLINKSNKLLLESLFK